MAITINNYDALAKTSHHKLILDTALFGLKAIDTSEVIKQNIRLETDKKLLTVSSHQVNLEKVKRIFVIGFGKASCQAGATLEKVLKEKLTAGVLISNVQSTCEVIETYHGTHPRPSNSNVNASEQLLKITNELTDTDLVIVIVSGGGSSLLCWPASECDQGQLLYDKFLTSGGTIHEINTVRKHISMLKGGGLAKQLYPAQVIGLIFSDIPGGAYEMIASGPTYYDYSTSQDAQEVITKYNLGKFSLLETPKDHRWFEKVTNIPLVSNQHALTAMKTFTESQGLTGKIIGHDFYLEPKDLLQTMMDNAEAGSVVLAGGETRLLIPTGTKTGVGGRNTHTAMVAQSLIKEKQYFISIASDGYDNCLASGAIVSGEDTANLNFENDLLSFNSYEYFDKLNQLIFTGPTEANVSDLYLLYTKP